MVKRLCSSGVLSLVFLLGIISVSFAGSGNISLEDGVMVVRGYSKSSPGRLSDILAAAKSEGLDVITYTSENDTYNLSIPLQIGDGKAETYFQIGTEGHEKEILIIKGVIKIKGKASLTVGVKEDERLSPTIRLDAPKEKKKISFFIKGTNATLNCYNSTIVSFYHIVYQQGSRGEIIDSQVYKYVEIGYGARSVTLQGAKVGGVKLSTISEDCARVKNCEMNGQFPVYAGHGANVVVYDSEIKSGTIVSRNKTHLILEGCQLAGSVRFDVRDNSSTIMVRYYCLVRVLDKNGNPLSGKKVSVEHKESGDKEELVTDGQGKCFFKVTSKMIDNPGSQEIHNYSYRITVDGKTVKDGWNPEKNVTLEYRRKDGNYEEKSAPFDGVKSYMLAERLVRKYYPCIKTSISPVIDGELNEWEKAIPLPLRKRCPTGNFIFREVNDMDAVGYLMWDKNNLYLACDVKDDIFFQPFSGRKAWYGDNIQLAFDALHDTERGWGTDDYEYVLAKTKKGYEVWSCRGTEVGKVDGIEIAVQQSEGRCIYEASIPFDKIRPLKPALNNLFRFNLLVADNDGKGRKGWIGWTAWKSPSLYGSICMVNSASKVVGDFSLQDSEKPYYDDNQQINFVYEVTNYEDSGDKFKIGFQVKKEDTLLTSSFKEVEVNPGENRFPFTWDTKEFPTGKYAICASLNALGGSIISCGAVTVEKIRIANFKERIKEIKLKTSFLSTLIEIAKGMGIDTSFPEVTLNVLEEFEHWTEVDLNRKKFDKVEHYLNYLNPSADRAILEVKKYLKNPSEVRKVPQPQMTNLTIKDGFFYKNGEPVFVFGVIPYKGTYYPRIKNLGFNIVEIHEQGARAILPEPDKIVPPQSLPRYGMSFLDLFKNAKENNLAVSLVIPLHYFPKWPYKADPETKNCGAAWGSPCFENPLVREIYEKYWREVISTVKDEPALFCYGLANEIFWEKPEEYCKYCLAKYKKWLKMRYNSIEKLNEIWETEYDDFSSIDKPFISKEHRPSWYDWNIFKCRSTTEFFRWERKIIREMDKSTPMNIEKAAYYDMFAFSNRMGIDWEKDAKLFEINGVDTATKWEQIFALNASERTCKSMIYDLMKSLAPDKPIFDSEYHIVTDDNTKTKKELEYIPPDYVRTTCWQGVLHGQAAASVWLYMHEYNHPYPCRQYCLLDHPEALEALGRTFLEIRALFKYIIPFSQEKGKFAILYSMPSRFNAPSYVEEIRRVYKALFFLDLPVKFISENQIAEGKLRDYEILIVPNAANVTDVTYRKIKHYVNKGKTLFVMGKDSLKFDEYGRGRNRGDFLKVMEEAENLGMKPMLSEFGKGKIYYFPFSLSPQKYNSIFDSLLDELGIEREIRVIGKDGKRIFGVESRTVKTAKKRLTYIINLTSEKIKIKLKTKETFQKIRNLITGENEEKEIMLQPLDIVLLELF